MATSPAALGDPALARCATHPETPARGACARCGAFFCALDRLKVGSAVYCGACGVRPEIDYLETLRKEVWGKRDAWAWLVGIGALSGIPLLITLVAAQQYPAAALTVVSSAVGVAFFLGVRWARPGFLIARVAEVFLAVAQENFAAAGAQVLPLMITLGILSSTRNQLFFKRDVGRAALQRLWDLYRNNQLARIGFTLSILGLALPLVAPLAAILSALGLARVDPKATPPIGRRKQAIAGIVLGVLSTVFWGRIFLTAISGASGGPFSR